MEDDTTQRGRDLADDLRLAKAARRLFAALNSRQSDLAALGTLYSLIASIPAGPDATETFDILAKRVELLPREFVITEPNHNQSRRGLTVRAVGSQISIVSGYTYDKDSIDLTPEEAAALGRRLVRLAEGVKP